MTRATKRPQSPARPSAESLTEAALRYLARFAASEGDVRRVLRARVRRAMREDADFAADRAAQAALSDAIERIIAHHRSSGALDDGAFAAMKVRSGRGRGRSARRIAEDMARHGVQRDVLQAALESGEEGDADEAERQAARRFARRRRLGAYRPSPEDDSGLTEAARERRRKDLATLARAGFSISVARQALDPDDDA